jgi:hypothetical protein
MVAEYATAAISDVSPCTPWSPWPGTGPCRYPESTSMQPRVSCGPTGRRSSPSSSPPPPASSRRIERDDQESTRSAGGIEDHFSRFRIQNLDDHLYDIAGSEELTKPASRVGGVVVRFGRTIAMPYSAAIPSPPHRPRHATHNRFGSRRTGTPCARHSETSVSRS